MKDEVRLASAAHEMNHTNMSREEYQALNVARFIRTARQLANGGIGVVAGVRDLVVYGREAGIDEATQSFGTSSASNLSPPIIFRSDPSVLSGRLRRSAEKDFEIEEFEGRVRQDVIESCRRLLERFAKHLQE